MTHSTFKDDLYVGKTVYVSGGTSGINLGIASGFARLGANLALIGRNEEKAQKAAAEVDQLGPGKVIALTTDVRDYDGVEETLKQTKEQLGSLDVVIAGAAGNFPAPAISINNKGFQAVVDIDLMGTYNTFHASFGIIERPGSMIAITAPQAVLPMTWQAHVCAAKAGVNKLVETLAMEWGAAKIRVNGLCPGPIDGTEGMDRLAPTEEIRNMFKKTVAMKDFGDMDECADAAIYLASPAAKYVTGTILEADGGMTLGDASRDSLTPTR